MRHQYISTLRNSGIRTMRQKCLYQPHVSQDRHSSSVQFARLYHAPSVRIPLDPSRVLTNSFSVFESTPRCSVVSVENASNAAVSAGESAALLSPSATHMVRTNKTYRPCQSNLPGAPSASTSIFPMAISLARLSSCSFCNALTFLLEIKARKIIV